MTMISSTPLRRMRRAALAGASLGTLVLALAIPATLHAQSFNGTGTATGASISTSTGRTDITVNSTQAIIDWTTTAPASGTVVFQDAGTTAAFTSGVSFVGNYTVLNRVTPVDVNGAPTAARIEFDGTVTSTVGGLPGGNVWFYSPNGIIVGATASFSVGGLVLTTNPIDTTGGLFGTKGEIRFRGSAGSTGLVQIQPGASITASSNPQIGTQAYVAIVAPRIEQGGTVTADGSIGYVAAEDADVTINAGFFDIFVNAGTTDGNGVVHTGTTTGAASTGTTDTRTIYMVAVPKNDGLTMLLNGNIGYAAAASASNDGAAVVLAAGHGLNYDTGSSLTNPANIAIGDAIFSSVTTATATDAITVTPTTLTQFDRFATLSAFNTVSLTASGTAKILANDTIGLGADYSLDISSGNGGTGGAITLTASGTGAITAAGRVRLGANGDGSTASSGRNGTGGTIIVNVSGGSVSAANLDVSAAGLGGDGGDLVGGSGTGGSVNLTASNSGSITAQSVNLSASGTGGAGIAGGGDGRGGSVSLTSTLGLLDFGTVTLLATAQGGSSSGPAGNATGGTAAISLSGTSQNWTDLTVDASTVAGQTFGVGVAAGSATGDLANGVSLSIQSATLNLTGSASLQNTAEGQVGDAAGTFARAGSATVKVGSGGALNTGAGLFVNASAGFNIDSLSTSPNYTPEMTGGVAGVLIDGGSISAQVLDVHADATGLGALVGAGGATGGTAQVVVRGGGTLDIADPLGRLSGALTVSASANGNYSTFIGSTFGTVADGYASAAQGGTALLQLDSGTITVANDTSILATGTAGPSATIGGAASIGNGAGGSAQVVLGGGTLSVGGGLTLDTRGFGGTITGAAQAGAGQGGTAALDATGGAVTISGDMALDASGHGGDALDTGLGGAGSGGSASVNQGTGGAIHVVGALTVGSNAFGGLNGVTSTTGGRATAGTSALTAQAGTLRIDGNATLVSNATGGANPDGTTAPTIAGFIALGTGTASPGGTTAIGGALSATATGDAARADGKGLAGTIDSGSITATGDATLRTTGGIALSGVNGGGLVTAGALAITSDTGAITSTGLLQSGGASTLQAPTGITLGTLQSGSTTSLLSTAGAISVSDLLSTGTVTVSGRSVDILSSGDLTFTSADATAGDLTIDIAGNLVLATVDATGAVTLRSRNAAVTANGAISGTSIAIAAGTNAAVNTALTTPGSLSVTAGQAITLTGSASGATVTLSGGTDVTTRAVTATGTLDIGAGGAIVTNGDAAADTIRLGATGNVTTNGALTAISLIDMTAGGAILANGTIDPAVLRMTAGGTITTNATVAGGTITLNSGTDIAINAALAATTTLSMTAGGTIGINALTSGTQITGTSADIVIGTGGQLGQRGTTQSVSLIDSAGTSPGFFGGTGGTGGYSLDAAELQRVFADNAISFSVAGAAPATLSVGNLALAFGANGNIGAGGTLALTSAGRIIVSGNVALTTVSTADTLRIGAGRLDVATDSGSIALRSAAGTLQGTLGVTAGTFAVATSSTLAQLAPGGGIAANTALMDTPSGAQGGVTAGAINADVTQGVYVQNTGATAAYADRRGFAANALAIGTASNATQIVINGVTIDASGNPVTGLDTVGTITINGIAPSGGGRFSALSSVNGCIIGLRCGTPIGEPVVPAKPDLAGPPDPPGAGTNGNPSLVNDSILQVEVRKTEPATLLPLVDEPVTGVGNEDLWGDRCASDKEACEEGE